jgi:hypothetical protein
MPHSTPDGRYLVIEGKAGPRLWRTSNPNLDEAERKRLVGELMAARRALRGQDDRSARDQVHRVKVGLGERGPAWWDDGAPDFNRRLIKNTPYAGWWDTFTGQQKD